MLVDFAEIGKGCAKILLLVLNGCCILIAICAITFSIVDINTLKQYGEGRSVGTTVGDVGIMTACLLLVAIAAFGSVGAVKGNVKILYMYIGFLMIMVVLEMMIAIYVSVQRYGLEFRLTEWLRDDFFRNTTDVDEETHAKVWDTLQATYECCGLNGPEDYVAVQKEISLSCCPRAYRARSTYAQEQLYKFCIQGSGYYSIGCEDQILLLLRSDATWLIGVAITCFWFEAAGMLLATWVAKNAIYEATHRKKSSRY
ncbi:23 kDa integral membrane protein-like [Bicyclus anynana]|uniref:Tetraspanin n=1 Tax=Bicyclus anynana TaxID=110368 RepID=A0A6J1MXX7_BICAN|nr:23 kDa integral membrane protein-like [Bicyclus anynana]